VPRAESLFDTARIAHTLAAVWSSVIIASMLGLRTSAPHLFLFPRAIPSEGAAARAAVGLYYASSRRMNAPVVCVQSIEPVISARTARPKRQAVREEHQESRRTAAASARLRLSGVGPLSRPFGGWWKPSSTPWPRSSTDLDSFVIYEDSVGEL
jgi:hypothetical protein